MANDGSGETEGQDGVAMTQKYFSIKNCEFAFKCPRVWERLTLTDKDDERHCGSCEKLVYLCLDDATLARNVEAGHCVAVEELTGAGSRSIGQVTSCYSSGTESMALNGAVEIAVRPNGKSELFGPALSTIVASRATTEQMAEISREALATPAPIVSDDAAALSGVKGWLLFLCVGLTILAPIVTFGQLIQEWKGTGDYFSKFPGLRNAVIVETVMSVALMTFSIYAGSALWSVKKNAVKIAKTYFVAMLAYSIAMPFVVSGISDLPYEANSAIRSEGMKQAIRGIMGFVIWFAYLSVSERVRATYLREGSLSPDGQLRERAFRKIGKNGYTEIMFHAAEGNLDRLRDLVSSGAIVDAQDERGGTALMYAAKNGHVEVSQFLLQAGANHRLTTPRGDSAASYARRNGHSKLASMLE